MGTTLGADGDDDARELAALAFVNAECVGELEFIELSGFVFDEAVGIVTDVNFDGIGINGDDVADVAVEDFLVVVVVGLDDLVADAEGDAEALDFELEFVGRIERKLQGLIERNGAEEIAIHRREHLDVADGIETVFGGEAGMREFNEGVLDLLRLGLLKKKEVAAA